MGLEPFLTLLSHFGLLRAISGFFEPFQAFSGFSELMLLLGAFSSIFDFFEPFGFFYFFEPFRAFFFTFYEPFLVLRLFEPFQAFPGFFRLFRLFQPFRAFSGSLEFPKLAVHCHLTLDPYIHFSFKNSKNIVKLLQTTFKYVHISICQEFLRGFVAPNEKISR